MITYNDIDVSCVQLSNMLSGTAIQGLLLSELKSILRIIVLFTKV